MAKATRSTTGRSKRVASRSKTKAQSQAQSQAKTTVKAASSAPEDDEFEEFDELQLLNELESEAEQLEAQAQAAAETAAAAKAAYVARRTAAQAQPQAQPHPNINANPSSGVGLGDDYLGMLSRVFDGMGGNSSGEPVFDDMANGVAMVLGSGPAFATLGSMLANSTAQGAVLMNATQMQRQLDHVGLCCTSACVKQLLSINQDHDAD